MTAQRLQTALLAALVVRGAAAVHLTADGPVRAPTYITAMGNAGYRSDNPSVLVTGWNFCNEALAPSSFPTHPSPRWGDCPDATGAPRVSAADNALGPGDAFPLPGFNATTDVNAFAVEKELFLAARCDQPSGVPGAGSFAFHTIMLKSGNMDVAAGICPMTAAPGLGFNNLPMNQPLVALSPSTERAVPYGGRALVGGVAATYDVNASWSADEIAAVSTALQNYSDAWLAYRFAEVDGAPLPPRPDSVKPALLANKSFEAAVWWKNVSSGSTVFSLIQLCSRGAPWLMNYLKLMDARGFGGGYDFAGAGDLLGPVPSWDSRLTVTWSQLVPSNLYVPCHGGCWKFDGSPCDGDLDSDITRYICFLINGHGACGTHESNGGCPAFHVRSADGVRVYRNDTAFPFECYSQHCGPSKLGLGDCDPYSNPGPQELMMLYACSEWAEHGYPAAPPPGIVHGQRLDLAVGALGARVALVGAEPADVGAAVRAARGWAPLPAKADLPPLVREYPGWTRSWVGFDFGAEMGLGSGAPSTQETRYEWTGVDVSVLAATPAATLPSWSRVGAAVARAGLAAASLAFDDGASGADDGVPPLAAGTPLLAVGFDAAAGDTTTDFLRLWPNGSGWSVFASHTPQYAQSYDRFRFRFAGGRAFLGLSIPSDGALASVLRSGDAGSDGRFEGSWAFTGASFDFAVNAAGDMRLVVVGGDYAVPGGAPAPAPAAVLLTYNRSGWETYPASDSFGPATELPEPGAAVVDVAVAADAAGRDVLVAALSSAAAVQVVRTTLSAGADVAPLGAPLDGTDAAIAVGGGAVCVALYDAAAALRVKCVGEGAAAGGWLDMGNAGVVGDAAVPPAVALTPARLLVVAAGAGPRVAAALCQLPPGAAPGACVGGWRAAPLALPADAPVRGVELRAAPAGAVFASVLTDAEAHVFALSA